MLVEERGKRVLLERDSKKSHLSVFECYAGKLILAGEPVWLVLKRRENTNGSFPRKQAPISFSPFLFYRCIYSPK